MPIVESNRPCLSANSRGCTVTQHDNPRTCFVEQRTNKPLSAIPREAQLPRGSRCMQDFVKGLKRSTGAVERLLSSLVQTCSQRNGGEKETAPKSIRNTHETRTHPVWAVASSTFPGTLYPEYSLAFSPLRFSYNLFFIRIKIKPGWDSQDGEKRVEDMVRYTTNK